MSNERLIFRFLSSMRTQPMLQLLLLLLILCLRETAATTYRIVTRYAGSSCGGTPYISLAVENATCASRQCYEYRANTSSEMVSIECTSDYATALRQKFGSSKYVLVEAFDDEDCSQYLISYAFPALGNCVGTFYAIPLFTFAIAQMNEDGSASIQNFNDSLCSSDSLVEVENADKETLETHSCVNKRKWYSSLDDTSTATTDGLSAETILGTSLGFGGIIGVGCVVYWRRKQIFKSAAQDLTGHGLWNDEVVVAHRIPRDKVLVNKRLSRGAYGEVYSGVFKQQPVAIKMLPPTTCKSLQHVNDFLFEAKLSATMEHPRIVSFVGIAWDSLSDLCVVFEFMDHGDLRSLLDQNLKLKTPPGLTKDKVTIALHICEALTYLHSLANPVIHRDLKSRNVLLNREMEAKLSDFGISREQLAETMTAGVGTTLWMAPEVMLGERYDIKADMFSFGVVLSELDVHTLPYTQMKQRKLDTEGHVLSDAALIQMIVTGAARVDFSEFSPNELVELGSACVAVDPRDRPSASQALYLLHQWRTNELLR